jgi:ribosomal protein S12 methylthiotransferase
MQNPRIGFVSLGCPKALVDSERILTRLRAEGYDVVGSYQDADAVVVNTCAFIDSAVEESLETIGEALNENGNVIVTGCLGARADEIREQYPQVLDISGAHAYEAVMEAVHKTLPQPHDPHTSLIPPQGIKLTPRHYAYLKISEGCNHRCSFCIIPSFRGDLVSRPIGEVMREAEQLVNAGVQEILVISQDTSAYGLDLKYQQDSWRDQMLDTRFLSLAQALSELGVWVRMHYVYPYPHVDGVVELMAEGRLLPYLDIPFQHASPRILKLMKRPASSENTLQRVQRWREQCPDITLRSTFIVGFPGETEQEFEELLDFLQEAQLDRVGCFKYSPVTGAAANDLPDSVSEELKEERMERFMAVQAEISAQRLQRKIGTVQQVLIDGMSEQWAVGRSSADAPEIDGNVFIKTAEEIPTGTMVEAKIEDADEHDLFAVLHKV